MKLYFNIDFRTKMGEKLQIKMQEEGQEPQFYFLKYNGDSWETELDFFSKSLKYQYQLTDEGGNILDEEFASHQLSLVHNYDEYRIYDVWNRKNFPENYLNNKILKNKLNAFKPEKVSVLKKHTHLFRIEAPLYHQDWQIVILGNVPSLGNWKYDDALPMAQTDFGVWEVAVEAPTEQPIQYKYGVKNTTTGEILNLEYGGNRWAEPNLDKDILQIQADHYFRFSASELYHAAGVAVPVFSLRSDKGFGVGEFADMKALADWAKATNLGIIQILPINDTTANYTWTDSYPYAAISVYALHPQYLSIDDLEYPLPEKFK
ncbi:MAG: 4-alpha-glucanotransferase, partial [Bergeyella zoohelcum]|nr:4-alpha-glucanotransferase [Bergeyella zoohelcum]